MNLNDPNLLTEVAEIKRRFEDAPQRARDERDQGLRDLADRYGLRQVDIITVTGYSRETVRQALNPVAREAVKANRKEWTLRIKRPVAAVFLEAVMRDAGVRGKPTVENEWIVLTAKGDDGRETLAEIAEQMEGGGNATELY